MLLGFLCKDKEVWDGFRRGVVEVSVRLSLLLPFLRVLCC